MDGTSRQLLGQSRSGARWSLPVALALALAWISGVAAAPASQRWITYTDETANLTFDYPAGIFTAEKGDPTDALANRTPDRAGRIFSTDDGQAILQFGTFPNLDSASVDDLRKRAIAASYGDARIEYNRTTDNWYVLSGTRGNETFYERVQFSCRGRRLDLFALTYPTAEAKLYDDIVDEMARRARPMLAKVRCPAT